MDKKNSKEEHWTKRKIFVLIAIFLILLMIGLGAKKFLNKNQDNLKDNILKEVKGVSTKNEDPQNSSPIDSLKDNLQEKLDNVKKQVNNLNVTDLASSSPQFEKVIKDMESLKDLPKNQARDACFNICKSL